MNLNPMGITGQWQGNYVQPGTANPAPPANQPEVGATGQESFNNLEYPLPPLNGNLPGMYDGNLTGTNNGVASTSSGPWNPGVHPSLA
jgi:hypothetical protein